MANFDPAHIADLLDIVSKCAGHSGKLSSLSNAAMTELMALNEEIRQEAIAKASETSNDDSYTKAIPSTNFETIPARRL